MATADWVLASILSPSRTALLFLVGLGEVTAPSLAPSSLLSDTGLEAFDSLAGRFSCTC